MQLRKFWNYSKEDWILTLIPARLGLRQAISVFLALFTYLESERAGLEPALQRAASTSSENIT